MGKLVGRDAFLEALGDPKLELVVHHIEPTNLREVKLAVRLEAHRILTKWNMAQTGQTACVVLESKGSKSNGDTTEPFTSKNQCRKLAKAMRAAAVQTQSVGQHSTPAIQPQQPVQAATASTTTDTASHQLQAVVQQMVNVQIKLWQN